MKQNWLKFLISFSLVGVGVAMIVKSAYVIGLMAIGVGIMLYRRNHAKSGVQASTQRGFELTDAMIIRFASLRKGIVSAQELSLQTSLNPLQAQERLEKLVSRGLAEIRVSDEGHVLYDFTQNILSSNKTNSQRIS